MFQIIPPNISQLNYWNKVFHVNFKRLFQNKWQQIPINLGSHNSLIKTSNLTNIGFWKNLTIRGMHIENFFFLTFIKKRYLNPNPIANLLTFWKTTPWTPSSLNNDIFPRITLIVVKFLELIYFMSFSILK